MGTNGLPIDDAMVTLVYSGELPEEEQELSRTALLEMLIRHGFDGKGGSRTLASAIDRWRLPVRRNGRVSTADLRMAVEEDRIVPTVRVYQSEWNQMMAATDPMTRLRMIDSMLACLEVPTRHYNERTAHLPALRHEVAQEVNAAIDIGPSTMPLPPDRARWKGKYSARWSARECKYGRCAYISA